ncbi:hypothetical protein VMCG_10717 [Cytospora schulzeri]|uniref:Uncharacterized protein n=1 Tax=Cytospora schulzeri TaxID=448051 RepID=A0A423V990_9PEZI|nr:hypothetical protein VMCG_10717 [Valsa malicola]
MSSSSRTSLSEAADKQSEGHVDKVMSDVTTASKMGAPLSTKLNELGRDKPTDRDLLTDQGAQISPSFKYEVTAKQTTTAVPLTQDLPTLNSLRPPQITAEDCGGSKKVESDAKAKVSGPSNLLHANSSNDNAQVTAHDVGSTAKEEKSNAHSAAKSQKKDNPQQTASAAVTLQGTPLTFQFPSKNIIKPGSEKQLSKLTSPTPNRLFYGDDLHDWLDFTGWNDVKFRRAELARWRQRRHLDEVGRERGADGDGHGGRRDIERTDRRRDGRLSRLRNLDMMNPVPPAAGVKRGRRGSGGDRDPPAKPKTPEPPDTITTTPRPVPFKRP